MIKHPFALLLASVGLAMAAFSALPVSAQRSAQQQQIWVTVLDQKGEPVRDLTADDFVVREDGVAREVISVEPAPPPSPIAILVDTSQAAEPSILHLRRGLTGFAKYFEGSDQPPTLGLWAFGERPERLADFTSPMMLELAIERLFHRAGTGAYFLEALIEAAGSLSKAGSDRTAVVAFLVEDGPEFSSDNREQVAAAIRQAGASLWTLVLQGRTGPGRETEARERAYVVSDLTKRSGGLDKTVLVSTALPQAFEAIAALLSSQQQLTYGRPDTLIPPEKLAVTTRRQGLRVLASAWTSQ